MAEQSLEQLEQEFHQIVSGIHPADVVMKGNAQKKWNSIAKPLHSLGKLEDHIMQIAALTGDTDVNLNRKALIVMCADNGVVEEGVTQTGQEVTAINFPIYSSMIYPIVRPLFFTDAYIDAKS